MALDGALFSHNAQVVLLIRRQDAEGEGNQESLSLRSTRHSQTILKLNSKFER